MLPKINQQDWDVITGHKYDMEFDWIGIDQIGSIGIFSCLNRAWIPNKAISSYEKYQGLSGLINSLPFISDAVLITGERGVFDTWLSLSRKGLYTFDYQDIHRHNKLNRYDLIYKPVVALNSNQLTGLASYKDIMPRFNLSFDAYIDLKHLEESEI